MKLTLKSILESEDSSGRGYIQTKRVTTITIKGFDSSISPERAQKFLTKQGVESEVSDNTLIVKDVLVNKKPVTSADQKVNKVKQILSNAGWTNLTVSTEQKSTGDVLKPTFEAKITDDSTEALVKHFQKQIEDFAKKNKGVKTIKASINGKPVQLSLDLKECGCEDNNMQYEKPRYRPDYPDPEGEMAKQQLYKVAKYAAELYKMLDDNDELDSWVQDKLSKVSDYISSVKHYLEYEKMTNSSDY